MWPRSYWAPQPFLPAVDPDVGLSIMARLLHQAVAATNVWSWQQAVFTGEAVYVEWAV